MTEPELQTAFHDWKRVHVVNSDYKFSGRILIIFQKHSGVLRCVVENDDGVLHIFSAKNLELES